MLQEEVHLPKYNRWTIAKQSIVCIMSATTTSFKITSLNQFFIYFLHSLDKICCCIILKGFENCFAWFCWLLTSEFVFSYFSCLLAFTTYFLLSMSFSVPKLTSLVNLFAQISFLHCNCEVYKKESSKLAISFFCFEL